MARHHGFQDIEVGDSVTFLRYAGGGAARPEYREATGKAIIISPPHWEGPIERVTVNLGGRHGTPGVVTAENFLRVRKRSRENPFTYPTMPDQVGLVARRNPPMKLYQRLKLTPRSKWMKGVSTPEQAVEMFQEQAENLGQESFWVVPLDTKNAPLGFVEVTRGSVDSSIVHPREVFAPAYITGAAQIMVFHNHPGGDPFPSDSDRAVTERLQEVGRIMDIPLLDHTIVGKKGYFSFAEKGLM